MADRQRARGPRPHGHRAGPSRARPARRGGASVRLPDHPRAGLGGGGLPRPAPMGRSCESVARPTARRPGAGSAARRSTRTRPRAARRSRPIRLVGDRPARRDRADRSLPAPREPRRVAPPADLVHAMAYMGIPIGLDLGRRDRAPSSTTRATSTSTPRNVARLPGPARRLFAAGRAALGPASEPGRHRQRAVRRRHGAAVRRPACRWSS